MNLPINFCLSKFIVPPMRTSKIIKDVKGLHYGWWAWWEQQAFVPITEESAHLHHCLTVCNSHTCAKINFICTFYCTQNNCLNLNLVGKTTFPGSQRDYRRMLSVTETEWLLTLCIAGIILLFSVTDDISCSLFSPLNIEIRLQ